VSEHSHGGADDAFHEIQLSGKQLVFLFMATTVVSVVIFLCGVLVGRGVDAENITGGDPVASGRPASNAATATDAAQPQTPPTNPPTPPKEGELSYPGRLEGPKPLTENLTPRTDPTRPQAQTEAANTGAAKAEAPKPEPPKTATAAEPAPPRAVTAATQAAALPGTWVVQVHALRDRTAASAIVARLNSKGYPAYVVNPAQNDPVAVYRVQVGRYKTRREAEQVGRRLAREEQLKPVISR
jgi:cell division protein FtsN